MRLRLMLAVLALSAVMASALVALPTARAQSDLDRAREQVSAATEQLEAFLQDLEDTQRRGDALAAQYWQVQSGLQKIDIDIAASEQVAADLAAQRSGLMVEVRQVALEQYVHYSEGFETINFASEADRAAAQALAELIVGADYDSIGELALVDEQQTRTQSLLDQQRSNQQQALDDVQETQASLAQELERLTSLRVSLDQELAELETSLDLLEVAEAERQAAAAEQARIDEERQRALAAAAAAAALARQVPTPAPTPIPTPVPTLTPVPEPTVPNPQPSEPLPAATLTPVPEPTVPNPQPSEPFPTAVPNPQPSEPLPTAVPNPQPSEPLPTATLPTAVPNPQPSTPVTPSGGGMVCPLSGAFTHTDDFNAPRAVGGVHRANDLIAATGTPVLAVASGTVDHRNSSVGGMSAHLKGDNGDYYFYTHLSGYENVGAGWVAAGTVIGYVGMTGNAPIPHLHFEIHRGGYGNYTNPYGPVRAACF